MINADNSLAENPLTPRQRLQDNIKINIKKGGRWSVGWFLLVGKSIDYRIFAKKLVNICPS
jgi:hypothetical protein